MTVNRDATNGTGTIAASGTGSIGPTGPRITSPPAVTNTLGRFQNLPIQDLWVVVAGETSVFTVIAIDPDGKPQSYQWSFGDGTSSDWSASSTTTPAYAPTDCGPYTASVMVTDGSLMTSSNLTVAVACQLNITKLQGSLTFAKTNGDSCIVKGTFSPPPNSSFSNKLATLIVGDVEVPFTLTGKGSGHNGTSTFSKPTDNKKTDRWTFRATLKNGSWQTARAEYSKINSNIPKLGVSVTMPVTIVIGDETFAAEQRLTYTAEAGKSWNSKVGSELQSQRAARSSGRVAFCLVQDRRRRPRRPPARRAGAGGTDSEVS